MALYDSATLKVASGFFYTAAVGVAAPTNLLAPSGTDWTNIGHTSLDDIFSVASDGGEQTVLGTLQAASLRTSTSARTESFSFNVAQWDQASLKLYYGANAALQASGAATGFVSVPDNPTPTSVAFLAVFIDGTQILAFYAPKTEITRGDDLSISDTTSLQLLPIKVTPLNYSGAAQKYYVKALTTA